MQARQASERASEWYGLGALHSARSPSSPLPSPRLLETTATATATAHLRILETPCLPSGLFLHTRPCPYHRLARPPSTMAIPNKPAFVGLAPPTNPWPTYCVCVRINSLHTVIIFSKNARCLLRLMSSVGMSGGVVLYFFGGPWAGDLTLLDSQARPSRRPSPVVAQLGTTDHVLPWSLLSSSLVVMSLGSKAICWGEREG